MSIKNRTVEIPMDRCFYKCDGCGDEVMSQCPDHWYGVVRPGHSAFFQGDLHACSVECLAALSRRMLADADPRPNPAVEYLKAGDA